MHWTNQWDKALDKYNSRQDGPAHLDLVGDKDTDKETKDSDTAGRHLHEDGGECVCPGQLVFPKDVHAIRIQVLTKAKALGDQTAEGTNTARGARRAEPHAGPHPCLGVLERLDKLVALKYRRPGSRVVLLDAFESDEAVVAIAQHTGVGRRVGQEPGDDGHDGEREATHEHEDGLVFFDRVAVLRSFADCVGQEGSKDGGARVGTGSSADAQILDRYHGEGELTFDTQWSYKTARAWSTTSE